MDRGVEHIYGMRFTEWLKLHEIQHISFPKPTHVNGILTDGIDFRFEDWGRGYRPRPGTARMSPPMGQRFFQGSFSAPVQNGFLNVYYPEGSPSTGTNMGSLALMTMADRQVTVDPQAKAVELPKQWFDFAVFYLGNKVVKPPEWPRDRTEGGTMGTVE